MAANEADGQREGCDAVRQWQRYERSGRATEVQPGWLCGARAERGRQTSGKCQCGDELHQAIPVDASDVSERPRQLAWLCSCVWGSGRTSELIKRAFSCVNSIKDDQLYSLESVVITYQALTFVCFQTGGILLNSNSVSMTPDLAASLKRVVPDEQDDSLKRLRQVAAGGGLLGSYATGGDEPYGGQYANWQAQDLADASLHSPSYYGAPAGGAGAGSGAGAYPSVYSSMFQHGGNGNGEPGSAGGASDGSGGAGAGNFMAGSTNIPPMPAPTDGTAPGSAGAGSGLQNLALASSTSYYSDYDPAGQYSGLGGSGEGSSDTGAGGGAGYPPGTKAPVLHRVRKNDRNRICTSCGTTNSPEWRKGPSGIKTLCNACGLRYARAQARKAKKAQKEAAAAQAAAAAAAGASASAGPSGGNTPVTTAAAAAAAAYNAQHANSAGAAGTGPESPYLNMDYSAAAGPSGAAADNQHQQQHESEQSHQQQHPGSTAPNYGGYGAFHGFGPYGDWSPATDASFAAQQQQGQGQGQQAQQEDQQQQQQQAGGQ